MIYTTLLFATAFALITRLLVINGFTVIVFCVLAALIGVIFSILMHLDD
jgi:hypothetical protein